MRRHAVILICLLLPVLSYADDQYIFDKSNVQDSAPGILDQQVTVKKLFSNINVVVSKLNKLGLLATVKTPNQAEVQNIFITTNGTIRDFINTTAAKFNYSVNINGNNIVFTANNPADVKIASNMSQSNSFNQVWTLDPKDKTLRNSLTKWTKKEGWQLVWNVRADYPITTTWSIPGTFEVAINEVLKASQNTDTPLQAIMHDSNHVLEMYSPVTSK
ncbi:MAG: hypothetical protein K0R94_939 [Burkholderiales bacterium]|jgi:hypothetical protein|nr:hypothetical protein [Burkholderiales bacterium]